MMTDPTLRAIVVDDEPLAGRRLARQLQRLGVEVCAVIESGTAAVQRAPEIEFDVAFLDIEMPGLNGLQTAAELTASSSMNIVFVTAHDEHALAAFDVGAIDYVLKPISADRLQQTLERLSVAPSRTAADEVIAASRRLSDSPKAAAQPVRLEAKSGAKIRYFDASDIQRLHAADKYVVFNDADGEQHVLDESLTQLELRLASVGFVRVHRRELVRLDAIVELTSQDRSTAVKLKNGEQAQVSRRLVSKLRARLQGPHSE